MRKFTHDHTTELLEDNYNVPASPPPLVVVDFKVYAHFILNYLEAATELFKDNQDSFRRLAKAMWAYKLNRGPDMLPMFDATIVVTDDYKGTLPADFSEASVSGKGYWRHIEAHKLDMPEYKGGRGEKSALFEVVQEEGYKYIDSSGSTFRYFSKEFFEADDIAGHLCRIKRNSAKKSVAYKRQLFLSTLDGDWQGLVSDKDGIIWANTGPWLPRLRSEREVCDYYLRKEGMQITSAKGCYDFKVEFGDMGDNLYPGTPLRFFDLFEEDETWKFSDKETSDLTDVLNCTDISTRRDHLEMAEMHILRSGVFLPEVTKAWDEDKTKYFTRAEKTREENIHPELKGRNRTACLKVLHLSDVFNRCKEVALLEAEIYKNIKSTTLELDKCKKGENEPCVKALRTDLKALKERRAELKDLLLQLSTMPPDPTLV